MWEIVRDVLSLGLAALGSYLAWRAITMGEDQDLITARQVDIAQGQEKLLEELKELEKRQAEIAEKQHALLEKQASKRGRLVLFTPRYARPRWVGGEEEYDIWVKNDGDKATSGFWSFGLPKGAGRALRFTATPGSRSMPTTPEDRDRLGVMGDDYMFLVFKLEKELLPEEQFICATLNVVTKEAREHKLARTLFWYTLTPDGRNPEDGFTSLPIPEERMLDPYGG